MTFVATLVAVLSVMTTMTMTTEAIRLTQVYGNNMVFQQGVPPCFRGYEGLVTETVTLTLNGGVSSSVPATDGSFVVCANAPLPFGGLPNGYTAVLVGSQSNTVTVTGILSGDVFLCSGQSNMQQTVTTTFNYVEELADANYPQMRLLSVAQTYADTPQNDAFVNLGWSLSSAATVGGPDWVHFSGVCFYFGRSLAKRLGPSYPIGLIASAYGGTIIEAWMSPEALRVCNVDDNSNATTTTTTTTTTATDNNNKNNKASVAIDEWKMAEAQPSRFLDPNRASVLWNAMIHPLLEQAVTAVLWYQGESNVGSQRYKCDQGAMVNDWRLRLRSSADAAFYFVQLSALNYVDDVSWPDFRFFQQQASLAEGYIGGTAAMVTAIDLGDPTSPYDPIHPRDKQTIGYRIEAAAANQLYGFSDARFIAPTVVAVNSSFLPNDNVAVLELLFSESILFKDTPQCWQCCAAAEKIVEGLVGGVTWMPMVVVGVGGEENNLLILNVSPVTARVTAYRYAWVGYLQCALYSSITDLPVLPHLQSNI